MPDEFRTRWRRLARRGVLPTCVVAIAAIAACRDTRPFHGGTISHPAPAPPLRLTDQSGKPFVLSELKGQVALVFFGYSHCPDVCPLTLADWTRVKRALGRRADKVRFVFVTVDPARDTPAALGAFLAGFDSSFTGLTGTEEEIDQAKRDWRVAAMPEMDSTHAMSFGHSAQVFVVGRDGRVPLMFLSGMKAEDMADDLKRLL